MVADFSAAQNYTDLNGLAALKRGARDRSPEALRETARQFEALFLQMMLKSMRDAAGSNEDSLLDNDQTRFYREMYDKQIALKLSQGGGIGLADVVYRQLGGEPGTAAATASATVVPPGFSQRLAAVTAVPESPSATATSVVSDQRVDWRPESPQQFVEDLWPHARRAGKELGVNPGVLIAQAALESGWGKHQIRFGDERPSFNLFGIKADGRWDGERVGVSTLEYRDGVAQRERAEFRAYESIGAAFDDYVDFIQSNPRYGEALAAAGSEQGYVTGLARAGYATDPRYADKILSILDRPEFSREVSARAEKGLKDSDPAPLT